MPFKIKDAEDPSAEVPKRGGKVKVTFGVRAKGTATAIRAKYIISDVAPYRFNTPDEEGDKIFCGPRVPVPVLTGRAFKSVPQTLLVTRDDDLGETDVESLDIDIEIVEVDAAGETLLDANGDPLQQEITTAVTPIDQE